MDKQVLLKRSMLIVSIALIVLLYVVGNSKFFFMALILNAAWLLINCLLPEHMSLLPSRSVKNPVIFYLLIGILSWASLELYPILTLINSPQPPLLDDLKKVHGTITWRQPRTGKMENNWLVLITNKGEKIKISYREEPNTKHIIRRAISDKQPVNILYSKEKVAPLQVAPDRNIAEQIEIGEKVILKYDYRFQLEQYENRYSTLQIPVIFFTLSLIGLVGGCFKNQWKSSQSTRSASCYISKKIKR